MTAVAEHGAATDAAPDGLEELSELELFTSARTIKLMGLEGIKSPRWLEEKARAEEIWFTPVGKTLMWSRQDIRDNIARMRHKPRNNLR